MQELIMKYIVAPVLAIIGIVVVGNIIKDAIGIGGAVLLLFGAVGGFAFFARFFQDR